jgi:hypothetical protein
MNQDREEEVWHDGFRRGYTYALRGGKLGRRFAEDIAETQLADFPVMTGRRKPKRKRPASKKQKLLKTMTDKKWKTYKGKKTWIQIRAQVSRSQAYKKKARRL